MKEWLIRGEVPADVALELGGYAPLVQRLLFARGITTFIEAEKFLYPLYERDTHDPLLSKDMDRAVARILEAVARKERITIFGDYDADGIPGASLLYLFLKKAGHENVDVYIPDRYSEKYGLSVEALQKLADEGTKVVVSVDCGITDTLEAAAAREVGIDLIITDHHLPHDTLPAAYAVVDHKRVDDTYPFKHLSGGATAYKLAQALAPQLGVSEREFVDLAAISIICDMMPLVGENRVLVQEGLRAIASASRTGLAALLQQARVKPADVSEDDIGFTIGPRINISSRMSHGVDAFHLLTTEDALLATTLAATLEERNKTRRATVQVILDSVEGEFASTSALAALPSVIVRGDASWRVGVLGLTAHRLMEKYARPVVLWTEHSTGVLKGSVRSDGKVTVMELFEGAGGAGFFLNYGGHDHSGGFSVALDNRDELDARLQQAYAQALARRAAEQFAAVAAPERYEIDAVLPLAAANMKLWRDIAPLAPFGIGNPKPLFLFPDLELVDCGPMGKEGGHLKLCVSDGRREATVMGFFKTEQDFPGVSLVPGSRVDLLANLELSHWRGRPELRLRLVDLRSIGA